MKEKLLKLAETPLDIAQKFSDGVSAAISSPMKAIGLVLIGLVAYNLVQGSESKIIDYGVQKLDQVLMMLKGSIWPILGVGLLVIVARKKP